MLHRFIPLFVSIFLILMSWFAHAFDVEREKLIAGRLTERLKTGEPVWLKSGKAEVLALYTEQTLLDEAKGGLLVLHGMGGHPDWPDVITHLRTLFPEQGWSTLSIQMPVLAPADPIEAYGETVFEGEQRIKAAVTYLKKEKEYENIAVVAYSFSAAVAVRYFARENPGVIGLVGISMWAQPFLSPRLFLLDELASLNIPLLDVYGSRDRDAIIEQAPDRRLSARKAENVFFEQIEMDGADHRYTGVERVLVKRIRGWLDKLIEEMTLIQDNKQGS